MRKKLMAAVVFLFAVTVVLAAVHKKGQEERSGIEIIGGGRTVSLEVSALNQDSFSGELIDGKGDVTIHKYRGVQLKDLLEKNGFDISENGTVTVTSADNYSVEFQAEEVLADQKLYLATEVDGQVLKNIDDQEGGIQAIVFGDPNSKRCVRYAAQITVE